MEATVVSDSSQIRIGCSGWQYKHWREIFYPKGLAQTRWFAFYAEHFDTVEINSSFYHLPKASTFEKWRDQAPPGFCYAIKSNRFITQARKLLDCEEPIERMMTATRHLGNRLGPMLYQLPPSLRLDLGRLEAFLELLPKDVTNVFEFRHKSWYVADTYVLLERHGVSLCLHDMRGSVTERLAVGPNVYVRFHGGVGKYWGRYSDESLLGWTDWIVEQAKCGRDVWCYFNNDIGGHAIHDALTLRGMVGQALR